MPIVLLIVLLFVIAGLPNWGYHSRGYGPSGMGAVLLMVLLILLLTGRI